jgi:serine/threonine-protein kinase
LTNPTAATIVVAMDLERGVRLSGHLLSEEIGQGGFSRVFKAEPEGGGPAVAIKVAVRPELVEALRAEGKVLRRLQGPRFVKILEEHFDSDPPFFVLELCEGGDLRARLEASEKKRLPPERVLVLAQGILEGVAFAHEEGLVHGDVKPENILLDAGGEPKIADLGLSRARRRELLDRQKEIERSLGTRTGKVQGTFDYMAPEVRAGGSITPASDVYALGVLLYELLVGARPYGLFRLPAEILAKDGVPVPPELDRIVGRALSHEPGDRYPDAGLMLADLLSGETGISVVPVERAHAGPNPLLLGLGEESFLDVFIMMAWLTFFCAVLPGIVLAAVGLYRAALVLLAIASAVSLIVVGPSFALNRLRRWRLVRRTRAALEEIA